MAEVFDTLFAINVNDHTEKKKTGSTELTYLSWAYAWAEVKKLYPQAQYEIEKFNGLPYVYDPLTGYMVYTTVTIEGVTHEMWLPVMDGANKAMKAEPYIYITGYGQYQKEKTCEAATMFDINKTIMRCLVKNLAMFGLGLYIYAGEDLPEGEREEPAEPVKKAEPKKQERYAEYKADRLSDKEVENLRQELGRVGVNTEKLCAQYKVKKLEDLTPEQYINICGKLDDYNRTKG